MTPESLRRFEAISRHPTISRGVLGVHFNLSYYDRVLAHDIAAFARQVNEDMHSMVGVIGVGRPTGGGLPFGHRTGEQDNPTLVEASQMVHALESLALGRQPEDPDGEDAAYQQLARAAHAYYTRSWVEQDSLLRDGYAASVASATARMPLARRFEFYHRPLTVRVNKLEPGPAQPHNRWPFYSALKKRRFQHLASNLKFFLCWLGLPLDWMKINTMDNGTSLRLTRDPALRLE